MLQAVLIANDKTTCGEFDQSPTLKEEGTAVKRCYLTLLILMIVMSACSNIPTMSSTAKIVSDSSAVSTSTHDVKTQIIASTTATPLPPSTATPTSSPTVIPIAVSLTIEPVQNHPSGLFWQSEKVSTKVDLSLCENSTYIGDVTIPDGTVFAPGETFVKKWTLKNTGFCMWKPAYALKFFDGNSMSGESTEIGRAIASGDQANIEVALTAPATEGTYTGYWIMADEFGYTFGMPIYVQIVVKNE
jgi:hypothetical protein